MTINLHKAADASELQTNDAPKVKVRRSSAMTVAIRLFIFAMFCLASVELTSRYFFKKTLENLSIGTSTLHDSKVGFEDLRNLATGIPIVELDHYIEGFAWRTNRFDEDRVVAGEANEGSNIPTEKWMNVRWPSLIAFYKIRLVIDYRDRVTEYFVQSALDND